MCYLHRMNVLRSTGRMPTRLLSLLLAAVIFAGLITNAGDASACSCVIAPSDGAFSSGAAVFEGELIQTRTVGRQEHVQFRVQRIWKGLDDGPRTVEVVLPQGAALCAFPESRLDRAPGTSHVIYAEQKGETLTLAMCGRFLPSADAAADLQFLSSTTSRTPAEQVPSPNPKPQPSAVAPDPSPETSPPLQATALPSPPPQSGCAGCQTGPSPHSRPALGALLLLALAAVGRSRRNGSQRGESPAEMPFSGPS